MSNYLEKYLKYKSKYQQLKIQKGGAKLGDHTYIIETGKFWGVIVGYNSSVNEYVVLQNSTRERFLKAENEGIKWVVDNSKRPSYPSKCDIELFIVKNRSRSDVVWFNPEEETQPKISPRGAAAVSSLSPRSMASRDMSSSVSSFTPRGAAAVSPRSMASMSSSVSSFAPRGAAAVSSLSPRSMASGNAAVQELIELARTNIEFQNWISDLSRSGGVTSDLLFASDKFRSLLSDAAMREMTRFLNEGGPSPDWMKVGHDAYRQSLSDRSGDGLLRNVQRTAANLGMNTYCSDCNKQVNLGTKCPETGRYHMG